MPNNEVIEKWYYATEELLIESMRKPKRTCGEYHSYYCPETGVRAWKPWYCKDYHNCDKCRARKDKELSERTSPLADQDNIRFLTAPNAQREKLVKKYGKKNCLFIPHDDKVFCVIQTSDNIGEPFTTELAQEISTHAVPPKGKRISGGLGRKTPISSQEQLGDDKQEVSRRVFKVINPDESSVTIEEMEEISKQVYLETKDLNPHTVEEVEQAVYLLEQKTVEIAERMKFAVLFLYTETVYILERKIDWSDRGRILRT